MEPQEDKLNQLLHTMVVELGAAANGALVIIGDKLGLYKELSVNGGLRADQLAERTGTAERYVREWLSAQAASGYITYDAIDQTFSLTAEQRAVFADENSPFLMTGGFYGLESIYANEPQLTAAFRSGEGFSWADHCTCLFCGTEKFFRPGYRANLISTWLPALDSVTDKLLAGAKVADVGCGHGVSTIIMAQAFPDSQFYGFDFHTPSIDRAQELAREAGITNVSFSVSAAQELPGDEYDLIAFFDCLHDMGDPVGAIARARNAIHHDGTLMLVEPFAGDTLGENLNPVGRVYYSFSTTICVPNSLSQDVGLSLGAQAGEERLREVVVAGGFSHFRRAMETPFNLVMEARP